MPNAFPTTGAPENLQIATPFSKKESQFASLAPNIEFDAFFGGNPESLTAFFFQAEEFDGFFFGHPETFDGFSGGPLKSLTGFDSCLVKAKSLTGFGGQAHKCQGKLSNCRFSLCALKSSK